jgi:sensitive to high expression protein 9
MSLIRSEHINDQAVQSAKDAVTSAEQLLDEARNKMEKMERMQYHEEQIWSDTIRRNSTWVTFGLMGVNILLLLVTMGIVEPWRRKRMVREIKAALEERMTSPVPVAAPATAVTPEATPEQVKEEKTEEAVVEELVEQMQLAVVEGVPTTESISSETPPAPSFAEPQTLEERVADLFSERVVSVRQRDISAVVLEAAAAGGLIAAMFIALLRPR